jgi:hypothetical protein
MMPGYLMAIREDREWPLTTFALWMSAVGVTRVMLQVGGFSLLLAAIFAGRGAATGSG